MGNATALQIRIDLKDAKPPIWRRILLPADTTLERLHFFLQGAFGWTDSHLHGFRQGDRRFSNDPELNFGVEEESTVTLGELLRTLKTTLTYDYDFGDDWEHTILLEKEFKLTDEELADLPRLIGGKRACPPEDCGGVFGYQHFLEGLQAGDSEYVEWAEGLGGKEEWSPEAFDREEHEIYMRAMGQAPAAGTLLWNPLEEQLAWATLEAFIKRPEWKDIWDLAENAMKMSDSVFTSGNVDSEESVPGFRQLVRDHAAFDVILEDVEPIVPELIRTHPDLPQGSQMFLRTMFLEPLAPYLVLKECNNGFLELLSLIDSEVHDVKAHPEIESMKRDEFLLARIISNGKHNVVCGQCLQSPFDEEEYTTLITHMQLMCASDDGDPTDSRELLKPAPPLMLALWKLLVSRAETQLFPLATYRSAEWEPGTSILVGSKEMDKECSKVLSASPDLRLVADSLWLYHDPYADPDEVPPLDLPGIPVAWVRLLPGQIHMIAGSRRALKRCRDVLKKLDLPPMRHFKTSYSDDIGNLVVPMHEMVTRKS